MIEVQQCRLGRIALGNLFRTRPSGHAAIIYCAGLPCASSYSYHSLIIRQFMTKFASSLSSQLLARVCLIEERITVGFTAVDWSAPKLGQMYLRLK